VTPGGLRRCGCSESVAHLAAQADYLNDTHRKRAARQRQASAINAVSVPDPRLFRGCHGDTGDDPASTRQQLANLNADPALARDLLDEPGVEIDIVAGQVRCPSCGGVLVLSIDRDPQLGKTWRDGTGRPPWSRMSGRRS